MSEKFTPGTWKAIKGIAETDELRCGVTVLRGTTEYLIATIENGAPGDFCETEEANAHLIASAPDLYDIVQLLQARRCADFTLAEWKQIDAVLAKARGEP